MMEILAHFDPAAEIATDFEARGWTRAAPLRIDRDWRGEAAPAELETTVRLVWSERELLVGFACGYEALDVDEAFDLREERHALWDRDVCEIFLRSPIEPHAKQYREFEVAPTGQWCDLIVDRARMHHDWEWKSGMRTAAAIDAAARRFHAAMAIPWEAFGCRPTVDDVWQGNLFRIGLVGGERQYLAYSPTFTEVPSFHVAERFVDVRFV